MEEDSRQSSTTPSLEERTSLLQSDLEALIRVRNRLYHASDAALPKILSGLLPRLLERLERNVRSYNHPRHQHGLDRNKELPTNPPKPIQSESERHLLDKTQALLTSILSHALERIRNGRHTMLVRGAPWIHSLLPFLQQDWQSPVAVTFLLMILQTSFPRYDDGESLYDYISQTINNTNNATEENNDNEEELEIIHVAVPALLRFVNTLHFKIVAAIQSNNRQQQHQQQQGSKEGVTLPSISESMLLSFRTSSWLCLDVLALSWGLPALIDWDRDQFDEYEWSTPCCSTPKEAFLEHGPTIRHHNNHNASDDGAAASTSTFLENAGSFQLWLDLLLFWSEQNNRDRRLVRTAAEVLVENSIGMTLEGINRLNHRCKKQGWNERYLRELKLACMHSIVVAPFRGLMGSSLHSIFMGGDLHDNNVPLLRHLMLCILTASTSSMHGKVALDFVNKIGLELSACNSRNNKNKNCRSQIPRSTDPWVFTEISLLLACSLLTLVLGDKVATPGLDKHRAGRKRIEDIVGPFSATTQDGSGSSTRMDTETPLPEGSNPMQRAPMPFEVCERTVEFILTRILPPSLVNSGPLNGSKSFEKVQPHLSLFVDLVVALSTSNGTIGSYWAIQCLDGLYGQLSVARYHSTSNPVMKNDVCTIPGFSSTCLDVGARVLSQIAEVEAETMVTLGEIQHPAEPHQILPGGVHGPFGRRRDLNVLLAQHRNAKKKQQLKADCALLARKQAYRIVTELAWSGTIDLTRIISNGKQSPALGMPIILLKCATGEEETSMHPYVTEALESWLCVYKQSLSNTDANFLRRRVEELLPSLLSAVCSESSVARMAAARWAVDFVQALDPAVTWHVCAFLAGDVDTWISDVAKKGLKSMRGSSPMADCPSSICSSINYVNQTSREGIALLTSDLKCRVDQIATLLDVPSSVAEVLLHDFRFCVEECTEAFRSNRDLLLRQSGVSRRFENSIYMIEHESCTLDFCGICYEDVGRDELYEMSCEHKFCFSCWQSYLCCELQGRPANAATALSITCPAQECHERVTTEDVQVVAPSIMNQWVDVQLKSFVSSCADFSSCPGPDCNVIAHRSQGPGRPSSRTPTASCVHCNTSFCFSCCGTPHQPAKCDDFAEWNRIFGSSQFWVKKNAKPCPGCKVPIEKNQGCNHMRCSRCFTDFCWLCLKRLNTHMEPHICNRYEPHNSSEDDEERRALFFTDRFKAHDDAEIFAKNEVKSFEEKKEKLSAESLWFASDEDLDNMVNAAKTLVVARNFLKNTYVAAWAMRKDLKNRDLFDSHQANLELFTEKLSTLLLTKVHQLYSEQGARAIHLHFRAMTFSTASIVKYVGRINAFMNTS